MKELEFIQGDARHLPLPDETVQCVVTSPPYWGLRRYAGEQELIWERGPVGIVRCDFRHDHKFVGEDVDEVREETVAGKTRTTERFYGEESRKFNGNHEKHFQTHRCVHCGAWRGAFGLEPTSGRTSLVGINRHARVMRLNWFYVLANEYLVRQTINGRHSVGW